MLDIIAAVVLQGAASRTHDRNGAIGVRIGVLGNTIQKVYDNTPAKVAGLMPGDKILEVCDDDDKRDIRGFVDGEVVVIVKRGNQVLTFRVIRVAEKAITRR